MSGRLEGKVALVTGTGGRQGRAVARLFAAEGAIVIGCDLDAESAEKTRAEVRAAGSIMYSQSPVDLGDGQATEAWIDWSAAQAGGIDILYNNASKPKFGSAASCSPEDWHFTIRNELDLIYHACHYAWRHMVERGGGTIINISSIVGLVGETNGFAHAAAKGGVIALTRQLASEGAPFNIRSNCISPGLIVPEGSAPLDNGPGLLEHMVSRQMLKRPGVPTDVAYCALYLCSDEATWVTGANFVIDGGLTAH